MPSHLFMTDYEVAKLVRVHVGTLRRWRMERIGPPWVKLEGTVRYPRAELLEWLEARLTKVG
jgi:DNA-binding transcriptional MerR regulator